MPPPSAIALISLVAVCLVPCRTKAGSRLARSGAVLLWLTVGYACHSSMLQHVAVTAIEIRKNTLLSISKGPRENLFDSLDHADFCMPVNHCRVWLPEFHQVNRSYDKWKSFTAVSILQLGVLNVLHQRIGQVSTTAVG